MLPFTLTGLTFPLGLLLVFVAVNVVVDVGILVVVDIDIAAAPVCVTPCVPPCSTNGSAGHKRKGSGCSNVSRGIDRIRWIGRICPGPIYDSRVIGRHIDDLRAGRFDDDGLLLDLDDLLLGRFQVA